MSDAHFDPVPERGPFVESRATTNPTEIRPPTTLSVEPNEQSVDGLTVAVAGTDEFMRTDALFDHSERILAVGSTLKSRLSNAVVGRIDRVITTGNGGAARAGEMWAAANEMPLGADDTFEPSWETDGAGAAYAQNQRMVETADIVLVFTDGRGGQTEHIISTAEDDDDTTLVTLRYDVESAPWE